MKPLRHIPQAAVAALAAMLLAGCVIYDTGPLPPPPPPLPPPPAPAWGPVYAPGHYVRRLPPGCRAFWHSGAVYYVHGPNYYRAYGRGYVVVPPPY